MLSYIKRKVAEFQINRITKNNKRIREFVNISDAFQIGIIAEIDKKETYRIVEDFKDYLRTEEDIHHIHSFYYVPLNTLSTEYQNTQWKTFISLQDLNFWGLPRKSHVETFLNRTYDIVIDLSFSTDLPILYVLSASRARMRVGPFIPLKNIYFDLIINTGEDKNIKLLIQTILTMLLVVNQKQ